MTTILLLFAALAPTQDRNLPYREIEGVAEDFRFHREWRTYYWREDFTFVLRGADRKTVRVISREPTPWNNLRLGTTFTGLAVDWSRRPRVKVIGVLGIDRTPEEFYDLKLDPQTMVTAFVVRVQAEDKAWGDYYVNNWFHPWGAETDRKVLAHFAHDDPNYTVYGFVQGTATPFDAEGRTLLEKYSDYGGVVYHARVVAAANQAVELRLLHLMGRHKKTQQYDVFHGDPATLVKLDGRKPRFVDVTGASGIRIAENTAVGGTNAHGVAVEDFDGDGRPDIVVTTFGAPHVRYFRNQGGLKFKDVTKDSGLETFRGEGTGAASADFDHDGKLDLYLTSLLGGSRLYKGKGDGTFVDVSEPSGTLQKGQARSCAWSDVDGDGWTDLYVTCPKGPNRLFRNNRDGTFTDIAREAGVEQADRQSLGCAFGDLDGDGLDDLFVANYASQPSALFKSLGGGKFRDITVEAGVGRKASAVGCAFADVFNRGRFDLYVTTDSWLSGANSTEPELRKQGHTVEPNLLYANDGKGVFAPVDGALSAYKSLSHDIVMEDLDHDGRVEVYVGVDAESGNAWATSKGGNPLWVRSASGAWSEESGAWGIDHQANCVCTVAADFDGDGDLDLLLVNFYSNVMLYRNDTNDRSWLRVRAGIGAKVTVKNAAGGIVGTRAIQSGTGYAKGGPLEAHFGLGREPEKSYRVEVVFPAPAARVVQENVAPGQAITVSRP
jgi:enediyne biosynthesis protein E4